LKNNNNFTIATARMKCDKRITQEANMATPEELDRIIAETISYSDGAFHMAWADGYHELTSEEQSSVDDAVYTQIYNCDCCGWHFDVDNLETVSNGEMMCWSCAENFEDEDEEEIEE
jgi:formylmethanofuran dehydrogenase subunit E